jgi:FAD/FMN-containing dehydrogenase/Fe-S oxidoreductase
MIPFEELHDKIKGDIFTDSLHKKMYATDASAYREIPQAVVFPNDFDDIKTCINFAYKHKTTIIPRAAGTSLAGQVVGNGIVIDITRNFNKILEINTEEKWVRVQPGVILDELNMELAKHGLFFGPETSTSNRCMIAGMVGNNSCGAHSLIYGSTRDHTLELNCILSDGSDAHFKALSKNELEEKLKLKNLEGDIYRFLISKLSDKIIQNEIEIQYPDPRVKRRNTGYALDLLLDTEIFDKSSESFNICKLLAGSEGTLAFTTEIKLNLVDIPPKNKALVCVHTRTLNEVFKANLIALKYLPAAVELMDKTIMNLTKENITQQRNRFFVEGDPEAILIVEFTNNNIDALNQSIEAMITEMRSLCYGYAYPVITGSDITKVWALRKAGLGVLSNMIGDYKPVPVTEDTAVAPEVLPEYMDEFAKLMKNLGLECVYYAHIGTGELHLRPIMNLKDPKHIDLFRTVALETAKLVKKFHGSLSGEHGDGRLRGEFIPLMLGDTIYSLFKELKSVWDPNYVFNANKIVDTPPMNNNLRYGAGQETRKVDTVFDFSNTGGFLRTAEKCNGSADCRKSHIIGGTLCPSFQVTRDEKNLTRARANMLREIITHNENKNPFDSKELYEILDLCLVCKACKSECPSGVDVAKMKMEFLQHYYDSNGIPLRSRAIAYLPRVHKIGSSFTEIMNFFMKNRISSGIVKRLINFAPKRDFPLMQKISLNKWINKNAELLNPKKPIKTIYLFNDEFSNFLDSNVGIAAILFFNKLGYKVIVPHTKESARTWLSKGLIRTAQKIINRNIEVLKDIVSEDSPLIGLEPSAILGFRDEYPDLAYPKNKEAAKKLSKNALMFEEFVEKEFKAGNISRDLFTDEDCMLLFHGHCQQKAIATTECTKMVLSIPHNYNAEEIPSGCCGMAGSFGYEKEHYKISMDIGEMVLFPAIRNADKKTIIVAGGTSCRCQIKDGTGVEALHPAEVMYNALK